MFPREINALIVTVGFWLVVPWNHAGSIRIALPIQNRLPEEQHVGIEGVEDCSRNNKTNSHI